MQSILSDFDRYLLAEGTLHRAYERLGAHFMERDGQRGVQFAVWAPNAKFGRDPASNRVSSVGSTELRLAGRFVDGRSCETQPS